MKNSPGLLGFCGVMLLIAMSARSADAALAVSEIEPAPADFPAAISATFRDFGFKSAEDPPPRDQVRFVISASPPTRERFGPIAASCNTVDLGELLRSSELAETGFLSVAASAPGGRAAGVLFPDAAEDSEREAAVEVAVSAIAAEDHSLEFLDPAR